MTLLGTHSQYPKVHRAARDLGWIAASFVHFQDLQLVSVMFKRHPYGHVILELDIFDSPEQHYKQVYTTLRMQG